MSENNNQNQDFLDGKVNAIWDNNKKTAFYRHPPTLYNGEIRGNTYHDVIKGTSTNEHWCKLFQTPMMPDTDQDLTNPEGMKLAFESIKGLTYESMKSKGLLPE